MFHYKDVLHEPRRSKVCSVEARQNHDEHIQHVLIERSYGALQRKFIKLDVSRIRVFSDSNSNPNITTLVLVGSSQLPDTKYL